MATDAKGPPRGLICPLVTPLKTGDLIDSSILERLIKHVGQGADALLLGEMYWGEGLALSFSTRLELFCAALEIIQGKWPIFINITSCNSKETRRLAAHTEAFADRMDYPGSIFWLDYPIYYHSNRGLPQWYESVCHDTNIAFILGNHAKLIKHRKHPIKHKNIQTSILKKISQIEKIQGMIFSGSLKRSINYQKATRNRQDFAFYDGNELAFLKQPSSNGVMAAGANLFPQAWRIITWSCLNAYDVQQQYPDHSFQMLKTAEMLREFCELYLRNPAAILKCMLHIAGILPNAHTAAGTQPLTPEQNRLAEAICTRYDLQNPDMI